MIKLKITINTSAKPYDAFIDDLFNLQFTPGQACLVTTGTIVKHNTQDGVMEPHQYFKASVVGDSDSKEMFLDGLNRVAVKKMLNSPEKSHSIK